MYCKYWKNGITTSCRHGDNCRFIHSTSSSSNDIHITNLDEQNNRNDGNSSSSSTKNIPCKNWDGTPESCKYGVKCRYLHSINPKKYIPYIPCKHWNGQNDSCPYGSKCSFLHAVSNNRPLEACCVCMTAPINDEKRNKYALLERCDHVICMSCAIAWRKNLQVSKEARLGCPICRKLSSIITPCYEALQGDERLKKIDEYKKYKKQYIDIEAFSSESDSDGSIDLNDNDENIDLYDSDENIDLNYALTQPYIPAMRLLQRLINRNVYN